MEFGLLMFMTDQTIGPAELGREAEAAGFESLFLPEHTHIPVSRESPWAGGAELPPQYGRTLDLFVALTTVAAATERLRVGSGVCLVVEHDPIVLAKQVATLDLVSGGRVLFGIGAGWNREEMADHGTAFETRFRLMRERTEAMRAIWTQDEAEYHGRLVDFDPMWCWPKPVQDPLPVLIGGNGPRVVDRVLAYGDGWIPNMPDLETLAPRVAQLQGRARDAGRDRVPVTYFGAPADDASVQRLADAGVDRLLFALPSAGRDEVLPAIESHAALAARWARHA